MDKGLRNTFIGAIITILVTFVAAWIQLNSRIAVLEVQVKNDREQCDKHQEEANRNMSEINTKLSEIQIGIQHLHDVKQDITK